MQNLYYPNGNEFKMTDSRAEVLADLKSKFPEQTQFTKEEFLQAVDSIPGWAQHGPHGFRNGNNYDLTTLLSPASKVVPITPEVVQQPVNVLEDDVSLVPTKMTNFVPFGNFKDIKQIVSSGIFFPVFITGLSGNGKTLMVEQVCAQLKREMFRVNITVETDEDDLIGGHTLVDGNLQYREGPVLKAMRKGAVLLLDEVDLGGNKLMCLQSILEGKGYLIKKTGEYIFPAPGFTIIATANTKGQGNEDGKFIGTQIMNEAMLERFAVTVEQTYPNVSVEKTILQKEMALSGEVDGEFVQKLTDWADVIRRTYMDGAIEEVISTRRLVHIVRAFRMFNDKMKSIAMCLNRFDNETRDSFLDLYTKIDENALEGEDNIVDEILSEEYSEQN
jgi:MoxR-like ATPase